MSITSARHPSQGGNEIAWQAYKLTLRLKGLEIKERDRARKVAKSIAKQEQRNAPPGQPADLTSDDDYDENDDSRIYVPGRGWLERGSDEFYECLAKWLDDEIALADYNEFTGKSRRRNAVNRPIIRGNVADSKPWPKGCTKSGDAECECTDCGVRKSFEHARAIDPAYDKLCRDWLARCPT